MARTRKIHSLSGEESLDKIHVMHSHYGIYTGNTNNEIFIYSGGILGIYLVK